MTAPETELVGFDLETTGLEGRQDRIVQAVVGDMNLLINPGVPVPAAALAVHGFTNEYLSAHGVPYRDGVRRIGAALTEAWDRGAIIVGHNIGYFDLPFLRAQEAALDLPRTRIRQFYDTYSAYKKVRSDTAGGKLTDMCAELGVALENAHEAGADARASVECARILRSGWQHPSRVSNPAVLDEALDRHFLAPSPADTHATAEHSRVHPVVENVVVNPDNRCLIRVTARRDGAPTALAVFIPESREWSRSMSVAAGAGRDILDAVQRHCPQNRRITADVAAHYGRATGHCLMCGKVLNDPMSQRRGIGPDCLQKFGP